MPDSRRLRATTLVLVAACGPAGGDTSTGDASTSAASASSDGAAPSSGESATGIGPTGGTVAAEPSSSGALATESTESTGDSSTSKGPALPACGDGNLDPGEDCDDGNLSDDDACTSACVEAFCGDGLTWFAQEECDDGNAVDDDGCTNACVERFPEVFVRIEQIGDVMWRYLPETDTYEERSGPGVLGMMGGLYGMAWDGGQLWLVGEDADLFRYELATDTWVLESSGDGPPFYDTTTLQWTPEGLFAVQGPNGAGADYYGAYRDGAWSTLSPSFNLELGVGYDAATSELFFRSGDEGHVVVVDAATDVVVRELPNALPYIGSNTRDTVFVRGSLYLKPSNEAIQEVDSETGAVLDTGVTPPGLAPQLGADIHKGHVYVATSGVLAGTLLRYDVEAFALTALSDFGDFKDPYALAYLTIGYPDP